MIDQIYPTEIQLTKANSPKHKASYWVLIYQWYNFFKVTTMLHQGRTRRTENDFLFD